ncbi:hypothetical protein [Achromobacter arsenitoxydans]|uniref:Uncharacterized protein n=1 Tax=Achromobacter arsenitoxydans SY8 TaxID=477184 RepID=H0F162_9BURK|nr:hypothetical protein [Achromobacter arsenitoxydans]EHK67967.1 hypothetical protein KYC_02479 [Achromobacter arsenitoxydans SY8]
MKVIVDDNTEFDKPLSTSDDLMRHIYMEGPSELTSRTSFALETMIMAGVVFIVSQAIAAYYRKTAADAAKRRHEEILAKLDQVLKNPTLHGLQDAMNGSRPKLDIVVDPAEYSLLKEALKQIEVSLPSVRIVTPDNNADAKASDPRLAMPPSTGDASTDK